MQYLNFSYVIGIDIDEDALAVCQRNIEDYEIDNIELLQQDIKPLSAEVGRLRVDTVIMNPPFGTKHNKGILQVLAARLSSGPQIRVHNEKLFFVFLNQNICCGYSKERSH